MDTNSLKTLLRSVILGQVNGSDQALALDIYEKLCEGSLILTVTPMVSSDIRIGKTSLTSEAYNDIMAAYDSRNKISAIREVRKYLNLSLKEAKDFVEDTNNFFQCWE